MTDMLLALGLIYAVLAVLLFYRALQIWRRTIETERKIRAAKRRQRGNGYDY